MTHGIVMVVEDDQDIRETLVELLNENGIQSLGMQNGAAALEYLRSEAPLPCMIILDLMMPIMDGPSFRQAQLADERLRDIPVVVMSAYRDVEEQSSSLRASAFIRKPATFDQVTNAVAQYC